MEFLNNLNQLGTNAFNKVNELGRNAVNQVKGIIEKEPSRMAGDKIVEYVSEVPDEGLIPVPTIHPNIKTGLGFVKSLAGNAGKPFRLLSNPGSDQFYQKTIDSADYDPSTGTIIFNEKIENKKAYDELGKNLSNKDYGRYKGTVDPNTGEVRVEDDYDTNRGVGWHLHRTFTGKNSRDDARPIDVTDRLISAASALHKAADNMGIVNKRPFGTNPVIGVKVQ